MLAVMIGPFVIHKLVLAALAGLITLWIVLKVLLKLTSYHRDETVIHLFFGGMLWLALFWKLGPLLFSPHIIWEQPTRLLWLQGGARELWIGLISAVLYIGFKVYKDVKLALWTMDLFAFGILAFMIPFYSVLQPMGKSVGGDSLQPIFGYTIVLCILMFVFLWFRGGPLGSGRVAETFLLWFGGGSFIVTFFKAAEPVLFLFSIEQIVYIGMMLSSVLLGSKIKKWNHRLSH